ncbi:MULTISPECIES: glutathione S-transferase family protein [Psychrobacter]|jgi:glutathione S-transferase|uniref:Glutathione S-transferase n=3 Tax=Psychrobacter TaxID=497 RepID=A0A844M3I2_9GAMM|nr:MULTISPECIES: glutathione binding-like protein [Psychrobacter]MUG33260.1 glutathione S-transferase [Psychrobacter sanguinis]UNK04946.1 glutathione binding-like protein [Psychrobacter sp. PraFG1]
MKLYVLPGACSFVPHTALEWANADYELQIMDHDSIKSEAYLKINPQGSVPALVDGDTVVTQNIAVQTYINARYPKAHIFGNYATPAEQAQILHWLAFLNSDAHKGFAPLFAPEGFVSDESAQQDLVAKAKDKLVKLFKLPNEQLATNDYLVGSKSTADLYLYVILRWSKNFKLDLSQYSNFNAFIERIEADAGVTKALQQEGLEKIGSL